MKDANKIENRETLASEIYTQLPIIKEEIERRWNDKELRKKVADFFGPNMLEVMASKPRAVLSRSIGTPNTELSRCKMNCAQQVWVDRGRLVPRL
jgi:hypothetical protein